MDWVLCVSSTAKNSFKLEIITASPTLSIVYDMENGRLGHIFHEPFSYCFRFVLTSGYESFPILHHDVPKGRNRHKGNKRRGSLSLIQGDFLAYFIHTIQLISLEDTL